MRVVIIGGAGQIGNAIATRLHLNGNGWSIHILDQQPPSGKFDHTVANILDYDALQQHLHGFDVVVHMAALRSPFSVPGSTVFNVNVSGTFNVFEAAAKAGIKRVVQASSINAIGCAWNLTDFAPHYFPIDEAHPSVTNDPYSFSKFMVEHIGDYYWRRDGISSVAFRFPWVCEAGHYKSEEFYQRRDPMRRKIESLLALPEDEQQHTLNQIREKALAYRASRPLEYPESTAREADIGDLDPLLWQAYTFDRFNLWAFLDERDAAQAVEKALTADYDGSHALFANDTHNWLGIDSSELARLFFPNVTDLHPSLAGTKALVSVERARELIGFIPEHPIEEA